MPDRLHYYQAHETEYVRRFKQGYLGWESGDYGDVFMKPFVERSIRELGFPTLEARALDLGCGTGPLSCCLAKAGFRVTGLDIAPSAIEVARDQASTRGLEITFEVHDVCNEPFPPGSFDLILDGHLLHCVVFEHERRDLLVKVRETLSDRGQFWVETMQMAPGQRPNPDWHLDDRGVVWAPCPHGDRYIEAEQREGQWWLPQRLIARSSEQLLGELDAAGLSVLDWEYYPPQEENYPGGFRARCARG